MSQKSNFKCCLTFCVGKNKNNISLITTPLFWGCFVVREVLVVIIVFAALILVAVNIRFTYHVVNKGACKYYISKLGGV